MDWGAIGAVVGLAAAVIAYLQYKHSRRTSVATNTNSLLKTIDQAEVIETPKPPVLKYQVIHGEGRYPLPDGWYAASDDPKWLLHRRMEHDLNQIEFAIISLSNINDRPIVRISLRVPVREIWSCKVEATRILAEAAIELSVDRDGLKIEVAEMPANERIMISLLSGGKTGSVIRAANAAVELKTTWD